MAPRGAGGKEALRDLGPTPQPTQVSEGGGASLEVGSHVDSKSSVWKWRGQPGSILPKVHQGPAAQGSREQTGESGEASLGWAEVAAAGPRSSWFHHDRMRWTGRGDKGARTGRTTAVSKSTTSGQRDGSYAQESPAPGWTRSTVTFIPTPTV